MFASATLPDVDARMTPRQFAGNLLMEEIARLPGKRKLEQVLELAGLSRSTIYNVRDGADNLRPDTYWALAGALGLPTHFFEYVIAGDIERIKRLPGRAVDPVSGLREDLRQYVLETLASLEVPRNRRGDDNGNGPSRRRRA
jgi:transcriptional regulator with XRE-family HTH domain